MCDVQPTIFEDANSGEKIHGYVRLSRAKLLPGATPKAEKVEHHVCDARRVTWMPKSAIKVTPSHIFIKDWLAKKLGLV